MTALSNITSKDIFFGETKIEIRLAKLEDKILASNFSDRLEDESKHFQSMGGFNQLSKSELSNLCDENSDDAIGIVALLEKNGASVEIGAARYIKNPITLSHEMSVTVSNEYRSTHLAIELVNFLITYARGNHVQTLYMIDMDGNVDMRNLAVQLKMSVRLDTHDAHKVIYSVSVDEHPGVVVF